MRHATIPDADARDPLGWPATTLDGPLHVSAEGAVALSGSMRGRHLLGMERPDSALAIRLAAAVLRGEADEATRDRAARVATPFDKGLPPVFDTLLTHLGIDPAGALALSLAATDGSIGIYRTFDDGIRRVCNIGLAMHDHTWVRLGEGITWRETEILMPRLPETIVATLPGRRLREVLSHPVLDTLDAQIVAVMPSWSDKGEIEIVTSLHPDPGCSA